MQSSLPPSMWLVVSLWHQSVRDILQAFTENSVCMSVCQFLPSDRSVGPQQGMTWPWVSLYNVEGLFGALLVGQWFEDPCYATWGDIRLCLYTSCSPMCSQWMPNVKACQCQELTGSWVTRNPATLFVSRQAAYNDNVLSDAAEANPQAFANVQR